MLPTPSTTHVKFDNIYEPAEDSFLLLDTLSAASEREFLEHRFPSETPSPLMVEVGTGSGVVLAFATANAEHIIGRRDVASIGTDVNLFACKATAETVHRACSDDPRSAGHSHDSISSDLVASIRPGTIDILIFNPPYVPTEAAPLHDTVGQDESRKLNSSEVFDRDSYLLSLSYAGGVDGMEITNRLLVDIPRVLSSRGVAYILLCAQNKPDRIIDVITNWPGRWAAQQVSQSGKTAGWEKLCVLRIWRKNGVC